MRQLVLAALLCGLAPIAQARDTRVEIPLQEVIAMGESSGKLDGSVRFYLAGADTPAVASRFGEGVSNKKTNAVNKTDDEACRWAALSVLLAFQNSAKARGADAVVDLVSYYKKNTWKDAAMIECHAGGLMAGVALKGQYAKLGN